jgi:hypothetical protein
MDLIPLEAPQTEVHLFNPTKNDFTDIILGTPYTIKAYEGARFEKNVGDLIATHLKDKIIGEISGVITDEIIRRTFSEIYL